VTYYLGIDGGGTKTTCAIGDDTTTLAISTAGPSNVVRVGEAQARESLHLAIRQACSAAGITPAQVTQTCIGAAGAARPQIAGVVRRALAEILSPPIEVVGDMHIALEAAFDSGPGVIVNAGTGSFAYGRDAEGNTGRVGGWGFAISDEGSAHWIGRFAITSVLRAADEQGTRDQAHTENSSQLSRALMEAWSLDSVNDLAAAGNSTPPPDFAALFPAVLASADAGDELAQTVLTSAGTELARLADIAIRRLFPRATSQSEPSGAASPAPDAAVQLAMAGGVFRHASIVRQAFYNEILKLQPRAKLNPLVIDPVEGALRLARKPPRLT
jgi:N-acetylglucosamine kinase-like BadF-type ATPase